MYFILSALLISLTYARNCTKVTEKCPVDEKSWKSRAQQFDCLNKNGKYTCLKDYENNLVETCVGKVLIREGVVGCPYILICKDNLALIGIDEGFYECPTNRTGCPLQDHKGYALHEIYKYPACTALDSSKVKENDVDSELQDKESPPSRLQWIPIVIPIIGIVTLVVLAFGILYYFRRKHVRFQCCGRAKHSENVELGQEKSSLVGEDAHENHDDLRRDKTLSDIQQFAREMQEAIERKDTKRIMEKADEWKEECVRIGIAGPSSVGKSSFINAVLGRKVAEIGTGNVTENSNCYNHPKMDSLQFWDLPGYGTGKFKLDDAYFDKFNIKLYDYILIFYSTILSAEDTNFVQYLIKAGKTFAIVKTRADDFIGSNMNHKPFSYWVNDVKEKCKGILRDCGITGDVSVYVISNTTPSLGDFDALVNFMIENVSEIKRMNILTTLKWQTARMIEEKESKLLERAWKVAIAMGVNTALPLPGTDIVINMALLKTEIDFYLETFHLDQKSLKDHPQFNVKQLKTVNRIMKVGCGKFIANSLAKCAVLIAACNFFEYAVPMLGGIVNGVSTTSRMYSFLKDTIHGLAHDANILLELHTTEI